MAWNFSSWELRYCTALGMVSPLHSMSSLQILPGVAAGVGHGRPGAGTRESPLHSQAASSAVPRARTRQPGPPGTALGLPPGEGEAHPIASAPWAGARARGQRSSRRGASACSRGELPACSAMRSPAPGRGTWKGKGGNGRQPAHPPTHPSPLLPSLHPPSTHHPPLSVCLSVHFPIIHLLSIHLSTIIHHHPPTHPPTSPPCHAQA